MYQHPTTLCLIYYYGDTAMSRTNIYRYYVYAYLRSNGTPYYIGKGCNKRAYKDHKHIHLPKDKSRIVFVETNLSNVGACALERRYIRWYGRKDLNTGILRNMTDGGDGVESLSLDAKAKIKLANQGRKLSIESKNKISIANKGRKHTLESRKKISNGLKGKEKTLVARTKMSIAHKNKKNKEVSKETRSKQSLAKLGKNHPRYGKTLSNDHRSKISLGRKKYLEKMAYLRGVEPPCYPVNLSTGS